MNLMKKIFGKKDHVIIGMIHCLPLPGSAGFKNNMDEIINQALKDAEILEKAGIDGVIVENMGDTPFAEKLNTAQRVALAAVAARVKAVTKLPVGIDAAFNDYEAALAIALAVGADFVRVPVFVDTVVFSNGIIEPCSAECLKYRKEIGAEHIAIFADIQVKHTHMLLPDITIEESAKTAQSSGADAIIITGAAIGEETPIDIVKRTKKVSSLPVIVASGLNTKNAYEQLKIVEGAIVGTNLKENGDIRNLVSLKLTKQLIKAANGGK